MKKSTIAGLFAGLILIGGALAVAVHISRANQVNLANQQRAQWAQAITDILMESNRCVQEMQAIVNSHAEGTDRVHAMTIAVPAMITKMRNIDTSLSPEDFQQAYLRYRQAWEGISQKLAQLPQTNIDALSQSFTGILFGNNSTKANDQSAAQSDELRTATNNMEANALGYGVHITVSK